MQPHTFVALHLFHAITPALLILPIPRLDVALVLVVVHAINNIAGSALRQLLLSLIEIIDQKLRKFRPAEGLTPVHVDVLEELHESVYELFFFLAREVEELRADFDEALRGDAVVGLLEEFLELPELAGLHERNQVVRAVDGALMLHLAQLPHQLLLFHSNSYRNVQVTA